MKNISDEKSLDTIEELKEEIEELKEEIKRKNKKIKELQEFQKKFVMTLKDIHMDILVLVKVIFIDRCDYE